MSNEPASHAHTSRHVKTHSSNNAMKWLAGAAAAAVLVGGGYYAWTKTNPGEAPAQVADNSENSAYFSSPTAADEAITNDLAANDAALERAGPASEATALPPVAKAPAQPKKAQLAAAEIPQETIGVSNTSTPVATNQTDELVVSGRRPVWRYTPRADRLAEFYPAAALDRGREGEASLHCMIGERGKLDCEKVSELPARAGFGNAALRVAHSLRHADKRADGRNAVGTPINLRVLFRMPEGERRG